MEQEMFYKNKVGDICRARDVFALEKKDISKSKEILESIYHTSVFAKKEIKNALKNMSVQCKIGN